MTCWCGAYFCWVCNSDITTEGYNHFKNWDSSNSHLPCDLWDKNVTEYKHGIDETDIKDFFGGKGVESSANVAWCPKCKMLIIKSSELNKLTCL